MAGEATYKQSWLEKASDAGYVPNQITLVEDENTGRVEKRILLAQPEAGLIRRFADGGIAVNMLWSQPGVWYDDAGRELPDTIARSAGYDVDTLLAEKARRAALAKAEREIEAQFQAPVSHKKIILERGAYKVVEIGGGRYNIEDSEGTLMNAKGPLTKDIAFAVLDALVPTKKRATT